MNIAGMAGAIYTRLTGDSTLTGLATGGIRHFYSVASEPENSQTPYVVFTLDLGEHKHTSRGEAWEIITNITVSCPRTTTFQTVTDIMERINGDATTRADITPSIGLHRWTPSLSGSWTAEMMACTDGTSLTTDPDWFHYTLEYRNWLSREAPSS